MRSVSLLVCLLAVAFVSVSAIHSHSASSLQVADGPVTAAPTVTTVANLDGTVTITIVSTAGNVADAAAAAAATASTIVVPPAPVTPPQAESAIAPPDANQADAIAAAAVGAAPNDDSELVEEHGDPEEPVAFAIPMVGAAASRCASSRGTCQNASSRCAGSYQSGMCPGAASIKCCMPAGASTSSTAAKPGAAPSGACKRAALASKAVSGAQAKSSGYCARFVGNAIQGVGLSYTRVNSAKDAGNSLLRAGFEAVSGGYQNGDVVVMQGFTGHPHGHIQIYSGGKWYSDFRQNNFWPGTSYANKKPAARTYRLKC